MAGHSRAQAENERKLGRKNIQTKSKTVSSTNKKKSGVVVKCSNRVSTDKLAKAETSDTMQEEVSVVNQRDQRQVCRMQQVFGIMLTIQSQPAVLNLKGKNTANI